MSFVAVAKLDELTADRPLAVDVGDDLTVALVLHGEKVFAIEDECSHGNVPLSEGDVEDETIECYLHGSRFDLNTGRPLSLPATAPVRVFECRIDGDDILIDVDATTTDY